MLIRYKSYPYLLRLCLNICLSSFYFGFSNGYFNAINFDHIVQIFHIEKYPKAAAQGILTGFMSVTGGLGAFSSSYLLQKFSRK